MRLHKRNGVYYASVYEHQTDGSRTRVRKSTGAPTKPQPRLSLVGGNGRYRSDPRAHAGRDVASGAYTARPAPHGASLEAGAGSRDTAAFYALKAGSLLREIGAHFAVARLDASVIDAYISTRRAQWADDARTRRVVIHTIAKSFTLHARAALKLALRRGQWRGRSTRCFPRRASSLRATSRAPRISLTEANSTCSLRS